MVRHAWLLPCLVLLVSGGTKLVLADGTPPRVLSPLLTLLPYSIWLRLLGLLELALAAALAWPHTRGRALPTTAALLALFTLLVGASAADLVFVGDCGCFGGLGSASTYYGWLVLRNAALVAVTVLAWRGCWRPAALALVITAAVPGVVGEMLLRAQAYEQLASTVQAIELQGFQGRPLPPLELLTADGEVLDAADLVEPGDMLAFVGRDCPHCLSLAPSLAALDDSLRADGRRVLLVRTGSARVPDTWKQLYGWQDRRAVACLDRPGLLRLGVAAVPQLVQLGPDREVQYNEAHPLPTSLWKSLTLLETRVPGLSAGLWAGVTEAIYGEGWQLAALPRLDAGAASATVRTPDGAPGGQLHVVQDGWRHADILELAVGLGADGRIVGVVPLTAGAHARVFAPDVALADSLAGLTLDQADRLLARHERRPQLSRPVWHSLRLALARVPR